jgi:ribosomal protein S18 acetylase RimI-like enzyme
MIRKLRPEDREQIQNIVSSIDIFSAEEKDVALELIDEAIAKSQQEYYNVFVYEEEGKVLGYHCTGKRALTDGVFDMYWIVVDPHTQNKGIGKKLLEHVENFAKERNGRWILAETSSRENYTPTRNFYLRNNYSILTEIRDFYSMNDNLVIFGKYIKI